MLARQVSTLAVTIGLFALTGCSSDSSPSTPSPAPPSGTPTINIVGENGTQAFSPNPASLGGQDVVFKNTTSVTHHVVLNDGSVTTGDIAPGATSPVVRMPSTGTNYHCSIHPGMIGSVNDSAGSSAPPCQGVYCMPY
jgi:plastocyanin